MHPGRKRNSEIRNPNPGVLGFGHLSLFRTSSFVLRYLPCLLLGVATLALTGCAADSRLVRMTPFTRGLLLIYDGDGSHCARKSFAEALLYLELETGKPHTVTVRAFDDHDRPMDLDPKLITWSTGINARIVPAQGSATVSVTLLGGDSGDLIGGGGQSHRPTENPKEDQLARRAYFPSSCAESGKPARL